MSLTVSLLVLIFISGVVAQYKWGVDYKDKSICALRWSTVTMRCIYRYPSGRVVLRAFWTKQSGRGSELPDLSDDPEYRGRVQYLGDEQHNCTLRLRNVRETDQRRYYFKFLTDRPGGKYQGRGGVYLLVTDLRVEVPERVIEGDEVTLTCKTTCSLSYRPTFTWYTNGHRLSSSTDQLHLLPVSREDAGRYHCAVLDQILYSPVVTLNVRYPPKSISVSISPSGEIVEGSSVTLTCSSDGNPPVEYNWIKGTSSVGKGEIYTMKKISSVDSGEYKCRSSNEHGEKLSEALTLNVLYLQVEVPERVIEGDEVTLTCKTSFSLSDRPKFTWYRNGHRLSSSTDQLHLQPVSREDAGRYHCAVLDQNLHSPVVTLNVRYLLVEVPERVIEGDEVTLTCKTSFSLSDRPTFTWYRNGHPLSSRTDQLHLQPVSREKKDRYHCAVLDQNLYSPVVTLNVRYPPKSISVSISPSGEIVEGSSVTLTCSSDGNPPVEYNWIKGTSSVGKGETYTMKKISSVDSGEYKCRSSNEHGEKLSEALTLNVLYLQVEVPERVIEGDDVTLTCKTSFSLSDRPKFTWYRNGHRLSSSTDQLHLQPVSREKKDRYHCAVLDQNLYSPEVTLNVRYGPKSVSVSISPSGEIVEGRSVTLTCSSDANPPVQNYTWFKGTSSVGKGETYTMKKISSVDSGQYKCRSSNEQGEKLSEALTLNVLYPPKNISVSISPSGETAEGSSVNLTCSSEANPSVQNLTWFKESGSSPVGSGHSYRPPQRGSYYCEAQNEHGSQKSDAVTVKGVWNSALYAVIGVTAGCGCLSVIIAVFCVRRKRRGSSANDKNQTQNVDPNAKEDTYTALDPVSRSSDDLYNTLANVDPNAKDDTNTALDPVSRSSDDVYNTLATVHSSPSDDLYSALDPQSRSPEYDTLATVRNKH
ncbi:hypothetical protein SRHO_G00180260 [Serrasalmus rhombeus]